MNVRAIAPPPGVGLYHANCASAPGPRLATIRIVMHSANRPETTHHSAFARKEGLE